jgi:hypothetical protein
MAPTNPLGLDSFEPLPQQPTNGKEICYVSQPDAKSGATQTKNRSKQQDEPDDIYDPAAMAVKVGDTPTASAATEIKLPNRITVDKPSKQAYIRSNPELFITTQLIKHEASKAFYYPLTAVVRDGLSEFVKVVELHGYVTLFGDVRFWPINVSEIENDWNDSAREILEIAQAEWIGYRSLEGRYAPRYPGSDHAEPVWPETTMKDLLSRASRGTRTIKDMQHKVALSLLGKK